MILWLYFKSINDNRFIYDSFAYSGFYVRYMTRPANRQGSCDLFLYAGQCKSFLKHKKTDDKHNMDEYKMAA